MQAKPPHPPQGLHATTPFVLYVGWTFDFIPVVWLLPRVTRSAPPRRAFMQQRPPRPRRRSPASRAGASPIVETREREILDRVLTPEDVQTTEEAAV